VNGVHPESLDPGLVARAHEPARARERTGRRLGEVVEATGREVATAAPRGRTPVEPMPAEDDDLAAVYRRLYPSLVRTAYLLVDTREQAEEVVQDAFAKAFPKWDRLRVPEAYLRTCVLNGCRRVQRRRGLARRLVVPPVEPVRGEYDHVAHAVRRLPTPQREVVVLRYYLQATDAEIAATLHLAVGTVKSSLHRARAALRVQFASPEEETR
jgi:DNA-directed RNA polymerase specialized sigma24 family protein